MVNEILKTKDLIYRKKPLIHCITNPISINQCANVILSAGGKPIMAEHPQEVCEITNTADALMLNIGNITDARMKAIFLSAEIAKAKEIPVLIDVVGVACSTLRRDYVMDLIKRFAPSVIKGNYSEIKALNDKNYFSSGVDADSSVNIDEVSNDAKVLSQKYNAVILATGKTDVITDGDKVFYVKNGAAELSAVTGTGCMLGALCTVFLTSAKPMDACLFSCCYFGICGELSRTKLGNGSFMVNLIDRISTLDRYNLSKYLNVEEG